jgi:hypothetical protein
MDQAPPINWHQTDSSDFSTCFQDIPFPRSRSFFSFSTIDQPESLWLAPVFPRFSTIYQGFINTPPTNYQHNSKNAPFLLTAI